MKHSYPSYNRPPALRQFYKYLWIFFLLLFLITLIIPTMIVFSAGNESIAMNKSLTSSISQKSSVVTEDNKISSVSVNKHVLPKESPLSIGWVTENNNNSSTHELSAYHNLKVVSPALVSIDNQYNLQVNSNLSLINTMHTQDKKIWARFIINNDTKSNVHTFLSNPSKTQEIIKRIYQVSLNNQWDGINLDIENVRSQDRDLFSQFVKSLSNLLNQSKIVLSIDLPPDSKGSNNKYGPFDHKIIGNYCDYIIFMGYDQHWSTDPVPGPVTSLSWLKENVQEFTKTGIPPQKMILGLPAYTRVWQQDKSGKIVKNPATSVQYVKDLVTQNHRNLTWNSTLGEYYTSYTANNRVYQVWLPTVTSFKEYLDLIPQYHLAGSAIWSLDLMGASYWNKIF
ncbi:glycosyl hydrolase family 18 protein [Priestia aryabhattai]|uniref:glycosyl hydrolase family 18 protein n=1 Tax=Priestia megaterium TaxID=1404 RepID=UPI0039B9701E